MNSTHFEASAKTGQNVKEIFQFLAESISFNNPYNAIEILKTHEQENLGF